MVTKYAHPRISTLNVSQLPATLGGWKCINLVNPDEPVEDGEHYPVLYFGPYIYTALSSGKDDNRMKVVWWDVQGNLVKELGYKGVQYIWRITFDAETRIVSFIGQSRRSIQVTLDELVVHPAIIHIPHDSCPVLPSTLTYASVSHSDFPVLKCGPYFFLPASYKDGRSALCVVVVQNDIIERLVVCPGTHTIRDIYVDEGKRTILLRGRYFSTVSFDYDTALACYHCSYFITKDDFLFFARDLDVPLSYADAVALENVMPQFNCALQLEMVATYSRLPTAIEVRNTEGGATVGAILGGFLGGLGGFLVGGPFGIGLGAVAGLTAGIGIGENVPSSSHQVQYELSIQEKEQSLVGYHEFPCGPFDNTGVQENIFDLPFRRYQDQPYAAALIRPSGTSAAPRAYSPATRAIGPLPRDPRYKPLCLKNGIQMMKYIFVIINLDETVDGYPGYQMRVNPDGFHLDSWPATQRVDHIRLSEGYRFWALVGHPRVQVYAAGSLYVDVANQKLFGVDTRTGQHFRAFGDQDRRVNDATIEFLGKLGYPTSGMLGYVDILGYMQEHM